MPQVKVIEWFKLASFIIPLSVLMYFYYKWCLDKFTILYACLRMTSQLILIGFCLNYLFNNAYSWLILCLILFMTLTATWISLRPLEDKHFMVTLFSISLGSLPILIGVLLWVMEVKSLSSPRIIIPLAGMILSNSMNALSIGMERFHHSIKENNNYEIARAQSLKTALLPSLNTFFALGLVALPGMMTGQILSGISPLLAIRYQIMVMFMTLSSAGLSVCLYLWVMGKKEDRSVA